MLFFPSGPGRCLAYRVELSDRLLRTDKRYRYAVRVLRKMKMRTRKRSNGLVAADVEIHDPIFDPRAP